MAFGWDDLAILAASAASSYFGNQAADEQAKAGKKAIELQQQQWLATLGMLEPTRSLGYGATSDLASLYGYAVPSYTPLNQLASGQAWQAGAPITVEGKKPQSQILGQPMNPLGGNDNRRFGATINPATGTVDVNSKNPERDALATAYLRGETDRLGGAKMKRVRRAIDDLKGQGYQYQSPAEQAAAAPTAGVVGQPSMARFFTSPDYQFRLGEGTRAIENSAAARGGAMSGNAARAGAEYASGLASGEFGNYVSRLMQMAGLGGQATNTVVNAGQSTAANIGNLYGNIGNARASGYGSMNNAVQGGLQNWMFNRYLQGQGGGSGYQLPEDIRNFQYPFGG